MSEPLPADDLGVSVDEDGFAMLWERRGRVVSFVFLPKEAA